jgi:hypothetical protein
MLEKTHYKGVNTTNRNIKISSEKNSIWFEEKEYRLETDPDHSHFKKTQTLIPCMKTKRSSNYLFKSRNLLKNKYILNNFLPSIKNSIKRESNNKSYENKELFFKKCEKVCINKAFIHKNEANTIFTVKNNKKLNIIARKMDLEKFCSQEKDKSGLKVKYSKTIRGDIGKQMMENREIGISKRSLNVTKDVSVESRVLPLFTKMNNFVISNYSSFKKSII